mmetsp:Transcript_32708/g.66780  ORF Transcript_32708/g.66780 Transcript_32708/m.66780 type:complete len:87 (+) Transcript_32708:172-432(+)
MLRSIFSFFFPSIEMEGGDKCRRTTQTESPSLSLVLFMQQSTLTSAEVTLILNCTMGIPTSIVRSVEAVAVQRPDDGVINYIAKQT